MHCGAKKSKRGFNNLHIYAKEIIWTCYTWKSILNGLLLCKNSGFSSVPENMPKNANAALRAMSHAVHSFISLYIWTLIAPSG